MHLPRLLSAQPKIAQYKLLALLDTKKGLAFAKPFVGPPGLEPGTPCPESFRGSQVFKVCDTIFSISSGYFLRFLIYLALF